ncbi:hypothetical protein GUB10_07645 [Salegentibacter sp. BLCTC]|uniref:hypothetical protein n=1 Tax=Salegentibacter sp. BLCTC TaxID=2697368 RepID=UPI00187BA353|nr:hypothetical protein [Salegentibacter sp. BLCTC]MBE7640205.1 hypothetical protein [Salegentibacter sp. BLCTC]
MKAVYTLIIVLSFLSCSTEEKNEPQNLSLDLVLKELPQEWKLIKMSGSFENSETTGDDMSWQETYSFFEDGTFTKTRVDQEGESFTASGSFRIPDETQSSEKALVLTYNEANTIIGNCSSEPVEYLYYRNDENLLLSNWWACDGPGLFYEKVQ